MRQECTHPPPDDYSFWVWRTFVQEWLARPEVAVHLSDELARLTDYDELLAARAVGLTRFVLGPREPITYEYQPKLTRKYLLPDPCLVEYRPYSVVVYPLSLDGWVGRLFMEPIFQLHQLFNRYLRAEIDLRGLQEGFVPMLPYFAERRDREPIARFAVEVDNLLVDLMTGEAVESDLRTVIEAMPTPTLEVAALSEPPRGSTSSSVAEVAVRPVSGTVHWPVNVGAGHARVVRTALVGGPA